MVDVDSALNIGMLYVPAELDSCIDYVVWIQHSIHSLPSTIEHVLLHEMSSQLDKC